MRILLYLYLYLDLDFHKVINRVLSNIDFIVLTIVTVHYWLI